MGARCCAPILSLVGGSPVTSLQRARRKPSPPQKKQRDAKPHPTRHRREFIATQPQPKPSPQRTQAAQRYAGKQREGLDFGPKNRHKPRGFSRLALQRAQRPQEKQQGSQTEVTPWQKSASRASPLDKVGN